MPLGPVQAGLAERMGGGAPPAPPQVGPPSGPGGMQMDPQMGGGDGGPVQRLAESLGEARMAIGEMGPELFATQGKDLLRGFVGSITQLQAQVSNAQAGGNPQGMPGQPPGGGMSPPPGGMSGPPMGP